MRKTKGGSKRRGGKKRRRYTMSAAAREQRRAAARTPKARAQRRVAARKHGQRASTPLRQLLPACNRRQCPMRNADGDPAYPCPIKQAADAQGHVIESCPVPLVANPEIKAAYQRAIESGDPSGLAGIAATSLAVQTELALTELGKLRTEGFSIERPVFGVDGNGDPIELGSQPTTNPRAFPTLKLLEQLGHTGPQQAATPKAAGERKRDEGIGGMLDHARALQKKLASGGAPG